MPVVSELLAPAASPNGPLGSTGEAAREGAIFFGDLIGKIDTCCGASVLLPPLPWCYACGYRHRFGNSKFPKSVASLAHTVILTRDTLCQATGRPRAAWLRRRWSRPAWPAPPRYPRGEAHGQDETIGRPTSLAANGQPGNW